MDQLKKLFGSLSRQQIITIAVVVILVGGGLIGFLRWNKERGFKPLFTGMSAEDAAAIVQKLKESGSDFRIANNGSSVLVPEARVDELRLEMSGAGLPKTGRVGFELFDKTNLGITDFTEHVNYRRALEGELERSIKSVNSVEQARVHLTFPKESVFLDFREPAKASIIVSTRLGSHLNPQNVQAISNLVASAVEGLSPDAVSILDMQGNLLSRPRKHSADGNEPSEASLDYKHQIEKDLVAKVESTLEPLLGEGHFRVGVSADCDFSTSEQSDEVVDPSKSAMLTSQKSEDVAGGAGASSGTPGTPSNLPRAVAPRANGAGSNSSRRTESTSFETSKSVRHVKTPQGMVKRISASLLLDQDVHWEGTGKNTKRVIAAPAPERMKAINDIVSGVLGLQTERGDRLVIESLPFEQTLLAQNPNSQLQPQDGKAPASSSDQLKNLMHNKQVLIGGGAGTVVLLGAVAFLFMRKKKHDAVAEVSDQVQLEAGSAAGVAAAELQAARENGAPTSIEESLEAVSHAKLQLAAKSQRFEELRTNIRESVKKEPQLAADVLRDWLSEAR